MTISRTLAHSAKILKYQYVISYQFFVLYSNTFRKDKINVSLTFSLQYICLSELLNLWIRFVTKQIYVAKGTFIHEWKSE